MAKKHYYFVTRYGAVKIECVAFEVNTEINGNYTELTAEQAAFYKANPTASVAEVQACELIAAETTAIDLGTYKAAKVKALSEKSLATLGEHVSEYQLVNARLSLEAEGESKIYSDEVSRSYIETYLHVGGVCRSMYYAAKGAIEAAESVADVDGIYEEYYGRYDNL